MRNPTYRLVAGLIIVLFALPGRALARDTADLVTSQIVLERESAAPGERVYAGVLFKIKTPWHIYWKNPGEAGVATRIELTGPGDLAVGELEFPTPVSFTQPGNLAGYGYIGEAFLKIPFTVPSSATPGSELQLSAKIRWLACDDICVPGRAQQTAALKISAEQNSSETNSSLFQSWEERFPVPLREVSEILAVDQSGRLGDKTLRLQLDWKSHSPAQIEWFPATPKQLKLETPTVAVDTISFQLSALQGTGEIPEQFESLIVFTTAEGKRKGIEIPVSVQ